jgi:hypothetical protein
VFEVSTDVTRVMSEEAMDATAGDGGDRQPPPLSVVVSSSSETSSSPLSGEHKTNTMRLKAFLNVRVNETCYSRRKFITPLLYQHAAKQISNLDLT